MRIIENSVGSSPRVWGTLNGHNCKGSPERFIPTGVGNTNVRHSISRREPVHPHGCGEHWNRHWLKPRRNGSSPRVWGTLMTSVDGIKKTRFIPTGVGNTNRVLILMVQSRGSSPRVWGTPKIFRSILLCRRFIPTGVGNT